MLMALLLPDPDDPLCPVAFKTSAKELLISMPGWNTPRMVKQVKTDEGLHEALLTFIGDFADWKNSSNNSFITTARALVKAAHPEETPLVMDPFAGGGSIPLEALRLGCEAFASDLNPVACLILKVMLEDIPRHGPELAAELRRVGGEIKKQAEQELSEFYPKDPDGATPIAYLWARTVRCESPNCGAEIPLMRSFWLCKKASRKRALNFKVVRPRTGPPRVEFEIFEPKSEKEVRGGTVTRAKATCPCCNMVLPPERVRAQLSEQRGGADVVFDKNGKRIGGARMLAIVTLYPGIQGRNYRLSSERDYEAVWKAQKQLRTILAEWEQGRRKGHCPIPDEPLPPVGTLGFRIQRYGMRLWGDLFTARQKIALGSISSINEGYDDEKVQLLAALAVGKTADLSNSGTPWKPGAECPVHMLSSQKIPPFWDWAEAVLTVDSSGSFISAYHRSSAALENAFNYTYFAGNLFSGNAASRGNLPDESVDVWFTDPPYYDAVPYADLSDFFLVWLKRALASKSVMEDPFDSSNPLSPKQQEIVQDESKRINGRIKDRVWFEDTMALTFSEGRRILREDGISSVVFAHKTTEGWEALLSGMIRGGWTITGSWPIATEMGTRLRARDSAALATSVHLICRPRSDDALIGDWAEVLHELPNRVGNWMERLQGEGVRGADLVFACIGPALEIFSRYRKVETADGSEIKLAEYLEKVWEVVGRTALEQILGTDEARARNGMAGVLEEDARLTALFLWTLQSTSGQMDSNVEDSDEEDIDDDEEEEDIPKGKVKGYSLIFDVVRRFAQPLGIDLPKWEGRIIQTKKGVVRLLPVTERARQLFGAEGVSAAADWIAEDPRKGLQKSLFTEFAEDRAQKVRGRGRRKVLVDPISADAAAMSEATTLDRVHAAMLLQSSGQTNALRALLQSEQDRGPDFMRLANALSALYPSGSEEKRLLDAMILAIPR